MIAEDTVNKLGGWADEKINDSVQALSLMQALCAEKQKLEDYIENVKERSFGIDYIYIYMFQGIGSMHFCC